MSIELFDMKARALRRDRAARQGAELFLHDRAFGDCLERLHYVRRSFASALLIGCPNPAWVGRLQQFAGEVRAADPGPVFADRAGGDCLIEDRLAVRLAGFDLCVAIGTLDTVNDLPQALRLVRAALQPESLFIGAFAGGDSLPSLRLAMRAGDELLGAAYPRAHPRIEPAAVAPLLQAAGFTMPVVDVDRVQVRYASFRRLVADLRRMGATNILSQRARRGLGRSALAAATAAFEAAAQDGKTTEQFDIIHFAAWTHPEHS